MLRLAIVENEMVYANALKSAISLYGDIICDKVFYNGEDAIASLENDPCDIVLMDLDLGEHKMNGISCISHLKASCPQTLFMVLTVYEDHQKVFDALAAGALGYLVKSSSPENIFNAIRELAEGGSPMSPQIARKVTQSFSRKESTEDSKKELLSTRENEIINLIAKGKLEKEVAAELFISIKTVKAHIANIYRKLEARTRVEALNSYFKR